SDVCSSDLVRTVVRTYALTLAHKHVPEMKVHAGLSHPPIFAPSVGRYYRGMIVEVPLPLWALPGKPTTLAVHEVLVEAYRGRPLVEVGALTDGIMMPSLDAEALAHTNGMKLYVFGNDKH